MAELMGGFQNEKLICVGGVRPRVNFRVEFCQSDARSMRQLQLFGVEMHSSLIICIDPQ